MDDLLDVGVLDGAGEGANQLGRVRGGLRPAAEVLVEAAALDELHGEVAAAGGGPRAAARAPPPTSEPRAARPRPRSATATWVARAAGPPLGGPPRPRGRGPRARGRRAGAPAGAGGAARRRTTRLTPHEFP